jgi:hypothetical protein
MDLVSQGHPDNMEQPHWRCRSSQKILCEGEESSALSHRSDTTKSNPKDINTGARELEDIHCRDVPGDNTTQQLVASVTDLL